MSFMFNNIGKKIKVTAVVVTILGFISSAIWGITAIAANTYHNPTTLTGILIIVLGSLGSWLGSFVLYGFGQLIEDMGDCKQYLLTLTSCNSGLSSASHSAAPVNTTVLHNSIDTLTNRSTNQASSVSYPWICDKCGARNAASAGTCRDCGETHGFVTDKTEKPKPIMPAAPQPPKSTVNSEWKCPKCGYLNPAGYHSCKSCGKCI